MKCQSLFSGKIRQNISKCLLLKFFCGMLNDNDGKYLLGDN